MKQITSLVFFYAVWATAFAGEGPVTAPATLVSATVYRSGAVLTHTAMVTLKKGSNDFVVEGLSNSLDINSVQVNCNEKITIMSVNFSADYLKPAMKPTSVQRLEDSLEILNKSLQKIQAVINTDRGLLDLLQSNRELRGANNGLSVAELAKMMDYYKNKRLEIQNEIDLYSTRDRDIGEAIQKIRSQINEEAQKNMKVAGRLALQVLSPMAGTFNFTLSYMTNGAGWLPSYDLRADDISKPLNLVYKAKLVQTTGLDWKQVKLTLAAAAPSQNNIAPVLKSWFLQFGGLLPAASPVSASNYIQALDGRLAGLNASARLQEVVVTGYGVSGDNDEIRMRGAASLQKEAQPVYVLDGKIISRQAFERIDPATIKNVEVLKEEAATARYGSRAANGAILVTLKDNVGDYLSVKDNALNITYAIDIPYDIPGNGREQSVVLKEVPVPAAYQYYAAPVMDKDAYLLGEIANWEQLNLLPGEANIIFEGTYTGKTFIDPGSTNDTLNLTLGRDKRIVVKKEKLKDFSSIKFLGSNKKQVFTYELTVKNNKKDAVQMLLKDRYPLSTNREIELELLETSSATDNPELGILTWKLQLAPGESKKLRVSYSVKYPRDKYVNLGL